MSIKRTIMEDLKRYYETPYQTEVEFTAKEAHRFNIFPSVNSVDRTRKRLVDMVDKGILFSREILSKETGRKTLGFSVPGSLDGDGDPVLTLTRLLESDDPGGFGEDPQDEV